MPVSTAGTLVKMLDVGRPPAFAPQRPPPQGHRGVHQKGGRRQQQQSPRARRAVEHDPKYSAAWKLLGRALADVDAPQEALAAYRQGIAVAEARGDVQAAKEMDVFARRITKQLGLESDD